MQPCIFAWCTTRSKTAASSWDWRVKSVRKPSRCFEGGYVCWSRVTDSRVDSGRLSRGKGFRLPLGWCSLGYDQIIGCEPHVPLHRYLSFLWPIDPVPFPLSIITYEPSLN